MVHVENKGQLWYQLEGYRQICYLVEDKMYTNITHWRLKGKYGTMCRIKFRYVT